MTNGMVTVHNVLGWFVYQIILTYAYITCLSVCLCISPDPTAHCTALHCPLTSMLPSSPIHSTSHQPGTLHLHINTQTSAPVPSMHPTSMSEFQLPAFSAGALPLSGGGSEEWRSPNRSINPSTIDTSARRERWKAISSVGDEESISHIDSSPTPQIGFVPIEQIRLATMQVQELQTTLTRKDTLLTSLQQQVADMTRALTLQSNARASREEADAARERAIRQNEELQAALESAQSELAQAKQLLRITVDRHETKWRAARSELERSEAARIEAEKSAQQLRLELDQTRGAVHQAQQQQASFDSQVRSLSKQNEQLHEQSRRVAADIEYLARDHQLLQKQMERKGQDLDAALKASAAQSQCHVNQALIH
jgi:hypothetical protein